MNRVRSHKQTIVLILLFLYSFGITSFASIHLIHDLFHLLKKSQHLHDHEHHHHEQSAPDQNNHGHRHNKYIDAMLQSIEKEDGIPESHILYVLELYYHLNIIYQDQIGNLVYRENKQYKDIELLSTLYYPSPPTPPPELF